MFSKQNEKNTLKQIKTKYDLESTSERKTKKLFQKKTKLFRKKIEEAINNI